MMDTIASPPSADSNASSKSSLDLAIVPVADRPQGKQRSPEKVMVKSRRLKPVDGVPGVGTDDTESIDQKFAAGIKNKVALLEFECFNTLTGKDVLYLGQASILRDPKTGTHKFATRKHNLAADLNDDGVLEVCCSPHKCVLVSGRSAKINLPNTGWRPSPDHAITLRDGVTWALGFDVSLGPVINERTGAENWPNDAFLSKWLMDELVSTLESFDLVEEGFMYTVGLKIGIVAYNPGVSEEAFSEVGGLDGIGILHSWANAVKGFVAAKIAAVCGEKDDVMIYTGIVTKVCKEHIEYNANSYKGCSGAIVIVMDRSHPDFGKAIAIHVGYKHELKTNLGFKLAGNFDRPW